MLFHWSSDKQHTWLRAHLQSKADPLFPQFSLWLPDVQPVMFLFSFIAESLSLKLGPEGACRSIGSLQVHADRNNKRRHFPSPFIGIKQAWLGAMSGEKCVSSCPPPVPALHLFLQPVFISQAWYWPCCTAKRRSSWVTTGTPEFPKTNCYWFVWVSWISSIQEAALKAQSHVRIQHHLCFHFTACCC